MKAIPNALGLAAAAVLAIGGTTALPVAPAAAALPVFDPTNYGQNLLQAARALEQINNQVKSLQNQASMLETMGRNLKTISFPQLQRISAAMQQIDRLIGQAEGIQFKVSGIDKQISSLFPGEPGKALTGNQQLLEARSRLQAAVSAYRQSMRVQAQVAENVAEDSGLLGDLAATSQSAVGALQAQQAANQLLALGVKQQLQLQNLMAAEFRESAIARAREAQAEEDGRAETRRFLGDDGANRN